MSSDTVQHKRGRGAFIFARASPVETPRRRSKTATDPPFGHPPRSAGPQFDCPVLDTCSIVPPPSPPSLPVPQKKRGPFRPEIPGRPLTSPLSSIVLVLARIRIAKPPFALGGVILCWTVRGKNLYDHVLKPPNRPLRRKRRRQRGRRIDRQQRSCCCRRCHQEGTENKEQRHNKGGRKGGGRKNVGKRRKGKEKANGPPSIFRGFFTRGTGSRSSSSQSSRCSAAPWPPSSPAPSQSPAGHCERASPPPAFPSP